MTFKRKLRDLWINGRVGAAVATLVGLVVLLLRTPLERWSFDLPHIVQPPTRVTNVVLVFMDDRSHADLKQPYEGPWDRSLHAELVTALTKAGAKAIVFDTLFTDPGPDAQASAALAKAIRDHGMVVLGADLGSGDYYGFSSETKLILPHTNFLAATPYWGLVQIKLDADDEVREHFSGWEDVPSLSWELARLLGAPVTKGRNAQRQERWLNYYGPRGTIPGLAFHEAIKGSPATEGFFRDRIVFVGSATQSGFSGKRRDQFKAPYSSASEPLWPGVEFHAIQFLNLMRGDWLRRMPGFAEAGMIALFGLVAGFGLPRLAPVKASIAAIAASALVTIAACVLMWQTHTWFAWLVVAAIQIPGALAFSVVRSAQRAVDLRQIDVTTEFSPSGTRSAAGIPDHEMLRCIGSGTYGEVWLARSVTGALRAVKTVDRKSSNDPRFEREFAGLKKFEPISRAHEGLVNILHVGRNESSGQLYYVMELADSCGADPNSDPDSYTPRTLKTILQSSNAVEASDCVRISLALTSALAFLHEQGLVHRDIKPSNIIFVQGQPKLADIGLVAGTDETFSFVGTEGYIPPEGPGTPAADVYSLGKVLTQLINAVNGARPDKAIQNLQGVVDHACARNLWERHQSAKEMLEKMRLALRMSVETQA